MDKAHSLLMQLNLIKGLGAGAIGKILSFFARQARLPQDFFGSNDYSIEKAQSLGFNELYDFSIHDFIDKVGLTPLQAQLCVAGLKDISLLEKEFEILDRMSIDCVTLLDDDFPELLRTIKVPPPILYVQGSYLEKKAKRLAVVGARASDDYAQAVLAAVLPDVVMHGWQIVSGGALGADAYAHDITLQSGGKTVVVLGAGLLSPGPKQNIPIFDRVLNQGGSIISEFPLEFQADRISFPIRNRVIAGLAQGCMVVQAARKSGALITAQAALDENRHVFAVPGSLFSPLSEGCHDLIAQGATIVTSSLSILESLEGVGNVMTQQSMTFEQLSLSGIKEKEQVGHPVLTCFEGAMSIDQLAAKTTRSPAELNDLLFTLQLEGFVKQNYAGLWERV